MLKNLKMATDAGQSIPLATAIPAKGHKRFNPQNLFGQICQTVLALFLSIISYLLFSHYIFSSVNVSGSSMYPTLLNGGGYWLNRWVYLAHDPQRADIVVAKDPEDGGLIVKRVIALPGESVYLKGGNVYVNGQKLAESYLPPHTPTFAYEKSEDEFFCCGRDQYFLLGDNRGDSEDSRVFGPVTREQILGRLVK